MLCLQGKFRKTCIDLSNKVPNMKNQKTKIRERLDEHPLINVLDIDICQKIEEEINVLTMLLKEHNNQFKALYL